MNRFRFVLSSCVVALLVVAADSTIFAKTINVPSDKTAIQTAIDVAVNGDVVVVAKGTYRENIDFKGKAITVRSTDPTDKAVVVATVVDGNHIGSVVSFKSGETSLAALQGFTITNGRGTEFYFGLNDYEYYGGGIYCENSSPTLTNNIIGGNTAMSVSHDIGQPRYGRGGGVYCKGSSPTLTGNTIKTNSTNGSGGGVYCEASSATLTRNTISGNTATDGGGVSCQGSSPILTSNNISTNSATNGGGLCCRDASTPVLTGNTVSDNTASAGGGVYCYVASPTLTNNLITGNSVTGFGGGGVYFVLSSPTLRGNTINGNSATDGGGVYGLTSSAVLNGNTISGNAADRGGGLYYSNSTPTLTNNAIIGNSAVTLAGGVFYHWSGGALTNNTLSGNSAVAGGGVYCDSDASPILKNTIIAYNTKGGGLYVDVSRIPYRPSHPVVTYSDVYSNTGGNYVNWTDPTGQYGNISKDPLFANAAAGDFRLKSQGGRWNGSAWVADPVSSPCIDAGDPASAFSLEPAPNGGRSNMGYDGDTVHASKTLSPTVTTYGPAGTAVGPTARINVTFSVAMTRPSAENALFINGVKAATVGGTFTWLARKMTFTPTTGWRPGTTYEITVAKTAKDRLGLTMGKSFVWSFTTKPASASAVTVAAVPTAAGAQITLNLAAAADVTVSIRNLAGREIAFLRPGQLDAGGQSLLWNGRSATGTRVPAGQYLLSVTARGQDGSQSQALAGLSLGR